MTQALTFLATDRAGDPVAFVDSCIEAFMAYNTFEQILAR